MKKKIRSVLTLGLTAILLIIGVLGVALGSHYVEYYGIGTNPLPKLTEEDIESMYVQLSIPVGATYFVRERTLTKEETAEIIERYNTLDADFLGCSPSAKPLEFVGTYATSFFLTLKNGQSYRISTYQGEGYLGNDKFKKFSEVHILHHNSNQQWKFNCAYEPAGSLIDYLRDTFEYLI